MFKNMGLKARLFALTAILASALLIVGTLSSLTLRKITHSYEHITSTNFPKFRALALKRYNSTDFAKNYLRLLIPTLSKQEVNEIKEAIEKNINAIDKETATYLKWPFEPGEEELFKQEQNAWNEFLTTAKKFISLYGSQDPNDNREFYHLVSNILPNRRIAHYQSLIKLLDFQSQQSDSWVKIAQEFATSGTLMSWLFVIVGFISSLLIGLVFSSSLSKALRDIANQLSQGAEEVASASQQVSASSEELSSAATQQAASLEETTSSIEEMSAMIDKNAENASQSQKVSTSSQDAAEKGKLAVTNMLQAMNEINDSNSKIMKQIEESNQNISEIVKVISEIGEKTKVINDIVFQTKLLSFNASVEAARAGEHGKGFAVVAEEVGKLAQMSGAAAKEISEMLDGSIKKVEDIVVDTKTKVESLIALGKEKVGTGTEVAKECRKVLDDIVQSITEVNRRVGEIATASQEQATGVRQINLAMGQLDQATRQNAAASQQTASSSEQLSAQAELVRTMVNELMKTIAGASYQIKYQHKSVSQKNTLRAGSEI